MAISYPTSLDTFTDPTAGTATNAGAGHASLHVDINSAVEALESRVGVTGSAIASSLTKRIADLETFATTTGAWTSWTPVWTQTATPTFTNTASRYMRVGRLIVATSSVTFTSAGTAGASITCTIPVNCSAASSNAVGSFTGLDAGTTIYAGACTLVSASTIAFQVDGNAGAVGVLPAWTLASTDTFTFTITYEAAS